MVRDSPACIAWHWAQVSKRGTLPPPPPLPASPPTTTTTNLHPSTKAQMPCFLAGLSGSQRQEQENKVALDPWCLLFSRHCHTPIDTISLKHGDL